MNNLFKTFLDTYLDGEKYDNKDKEYHKILCHDIPEYIKTFIDEERYKIKWSCGASYKADVPWIGVFNKNITETAQKGIYIVYLFKTDMSGFYLCLGQGVTNFEKYGRNKEEYMIKVANYFKKMTATEVFSKNGIDLNSRTPIGKNYCKVNVLSKYYDKEKIKEYDFKQDLIELVKIYEQIYNDMDCLSYDQIIENVIRSIEEKDIKAQDAIELINNVLEEEYDSNGENTYLLKEIDIPKVNRKVYKQLSNKRVSKIDYIKKAKKDAKTGLSGEELVLAYEKDKMLKHNRIDLIDKIDWVSSYDDNRGYDIASFEFDENGKEYEIYIEIKTTEEGEKSSFFISSNEMSTMKEKKERYWIYRVSKVNKEPVFYKINGQEFFDTFGVEPYTYIANFK